MPSSGKAAVSSLLLAAVLAVLGVAVPAQSQSQSLQARSLYEEALVREAALRADLDKLEPETPQAQEAITRVRALVGAYNDMARLFPSSTYIDNALWQGASLSADAFWQFGDRADRTTALRMFDALVKRFGSGSLAAKAREQVTRLTAAGSAPAKGLRPATVRPLPATRARAAASAPARPAVVDAAVLTAIRQEMLPDALRVVLELDREVQFHDERLDGPHRVLLDLKNTSAVASLRDAILASGDDVIQRVRVGRLLDARTRIVFDLTSAARYSVYTLYNPYRVVVDFERAAGAAGSPASSSSSKAPPAADSRRAAATGSAAAPAAPSANTSGSFSLSRQLGLGAARIVIDAGHGGHDPGAQARGLDEAAIVLDVALRLEKLLLKQSGVEVVLTRRTDTFVSLEERTDIANREGADLFLSIHANASADGDARGIETYFLNFAANPEAEAVAARENAGAARNMRHLPEIVKTIALNNKIDESRDFAAAVQASLHSQLKKANREVRSLGVKQAPFMVLIGATMPSVLAEISFISNRQDANYLKTEKYRQQIAEALLAGIMKYQQSLKRQPTVSLR